MALIQLRRDTAANWTIVDPILAEGEPGLETDTGRVKYGDGNTAWSGLSYTGGSGGNVIAGPNTNYTITTTNSDPSASPAIDMVSTWTFGYDGRTEFPHDVTQSGQDSTPCGANQDTVIYTTTGQNQFAVKLFVMVEGHAGQGGWDTQACDIICVRGWSSNTVHTNVYGVTHSSPDPLATFDAVWNETSNRIDVTCRPTSNTNNVYASVHAIELQTND